MISKFIAKHKKMFFMFLLSCVVVSFTFAADMNTAINNILSIFENGWVKGLCCILLIGECLGLLFAGGQNPQIFKKFLPFIIGTILFMSAGKIINLVWGTNPTFQKDLTETSQTAAGKQ